MTAHKAWAAAAAAIAAVVLLRLLAAWVGIEVEDLVGLLIEAIGAAFAAGGAAYSTPNHPK